MFELTFASLSVMTVRRVHRAAVDCARRALETRDVARAEFLSRGFMTGWDAQVVCEGVDRPLAYAPFYTRWTTPTEVTSQRAGIE